MNTSKFVQTEGYPLTADRLQELQTTFQIFKAFGNIAGNLTILEGCELLSSSIGNGYVYINGEPLEFRASAYNASSTVIIVEEPVFKNFKNGASKEIYRIRYAKIGTAETSWDWSLFKRPIETKDIQAFHTSVAERLTALETSLSNATTKLNGIESGAQKNVQSDFDVINNSSDAFIKNKPLSLNVLHQNTRVIGNITTNSYSIVISIPDVGTSNYQVLGSIVSNSANFNQDNNIFHNTREHTATSFRLCIREMSNDDQNVSFDYTIVKKNN